MNPRNACLLMLAVAALGRTSSFVIQPTHRSVVLAEPQVVLQSSLDIDPNSGRNKQNFLVKAANKIASWLPFRHTKDEEVVDIIPHQNRKQLAKEMDDALAPFPWPIRAVGSSLTRTVNREMAQEERRVKPLLQQAQKQIAADPDLCTALGKPIRIGRIISQSKEETRVNLGKKSLQIKDTFEIVGSKRNGVATIIADKYARGHLQTLRVRDDRGIIFDVDV